MKNENLIRILSSSDLRSLYSTHLRDPSGRRLNLANGTDLITGVAGDADVIATLESELNVADLKNLGAPFLGVSASCLKNLIDEVVCDVKDRLELVSSLTSKVKYHVPQVM